MHTHNPLSAEVPHTGRARWIVGLLVALFVVGGVIWTVALGFRGRHISTNAAALTDPAAAPGTTPAPSPPSGAAAH